MNIFPTARAATISTGALKVIFASLFLTFLSGAVSAQRAITNQSIEDPAFADNQFYFYAEGSVPGWLTSHPVQIAGCTDGGGPAFDCRPIERWSSGFLGVFPAAGAGSRWVELNAYDNSMIYQSVCMINGESFDYSFVHRGRESATVPDVADFRLGIPTGLPAGSKPADTYDFPIVRVSTTNDGTVTTAPTGSGTINAPVAAGNGWVRYSGTYTYTGPSQLVNMGFAAVSSAGGILVGNFIDDWQIGLSPNIEFSASSASAVEGSDLGSNTPANRPAIRVTGIVAAPITVTFQVTGGSSFVVAGVDYSLSVPFQAGNAATTATVTIPAGTYDGISAGSLFAVPFSISSDTLAEPHETVQFTITTAPGATIASVVSCGSAAVTTTVFTILNDEAATAAGVSVTGRVTTAAGRGIGKALVTLSGGDLQSPIQTMTSSFGYYSFADIPAGRTYVVSVIEKRHRFSVNSRVINLGDNLAELDFTANP